jgi:ArsR family transcriptional regulator
VAAPIQQVKAEFFKTMGHPARIRILELLSERPHVVAELIPEVGLEPSHLSQQLGKLRAGGLVTSRREGTAVVYALVDERIGELLRVSKAILLDQAFLAARELQAS